MSLDTAVIETIEDETKKEEKETSKIEDNNKPEINQVYRIFDESHSNSIGELAGALAKAQGAMTNNIKNAQGYGYKYGTLDTLTDIARPALSVNGLAIIHTHELVKSSTAPSVVTHTTLMHESGQWHKSSIELPIKAMKQLSPAQIIGIVCTYGRRYTLQSLCLIASEEDTDGN